MSHISSLLTFVVSIVISLAAFYLGHTFFPSFKLIYFSPCLIASFYLLNKSQSLWLSFFFGLLLDTLSSQYHFGLYATLFVFTSWFFYGKKAISIESSFLSLPVMNYLYTAAITLFSGVITNFLYHQVDISINWVVEDILIMSLYDALYALVAFFIPIFWIQNKFKKRFAHHYRSKPRPR